MKFDICIIGAGSAGMGAAYSLKGSGKSVCLIDKLSHLGGTSTEAGVTTWIEGSCPKYLVDILASLNFSQEQIERSLLPAAFSLYGINQTKKNKGIRKDGFLILNGSLDTNLLVDRNYTLTIKGNLNDAQTFALGFGNSDPIVLESKGNGIYICFFKNEIPEINNYNIYNYPEATAITANIEWMKMELGTNNSQEYLPDDTQNDGNLYIDSDSLMNKYQNDFANDNNFEILLKTEFMSVNSQTETDIVSINVIDSELNARTIEASWFIDCSGDGILCRAALTDCYLVGRDPKALFNESIALNNIIDPMTLNEPSLFFKLQEGLDDTEILNTVKTVYIDNSIKEGIPIIKPDYITLDGFISGANYVNTMTGTTFGEGGALNIKYGSDGVYPILKSRSLEYWKYIKLLAKYKGSGKFGGYDVGQVLSMGFDNSFKPYTGIRESFRIKCDYMLRQSDLSELLNPQSLNNFIAEGSHIIDFHVTTDLNVVELNNFNQSFLRPYGIPYDCLVVSGISNILVAGRCSGKSQIALASARVNKVCAQEGFAAGNAIKYCLDNECNDVRCVDVPTIQGPQYIDFVTSINQMSEIYSLNLKK
jgi:hypothetical protein